MSWLLRFIATLAVAILAVLAPRWWTRALPPADQQCLVDGSDDLRVAPPPLRLATVEDGSSFREALADRHELRPDRRFLIALALADCLLSGSDPGELRGEYRAGRWTLVQRRAELGSLPALPDFGDALSLISRRVRKSAAASAFELGSAAEIVEMEALRARIDEMQPAELPKALERIDQLWTSGGKSAEVLELAARGLVFLTLLSDDRLDLTDTLAGRAMVTLVMAREIGGADLRQEEALLALKMDYGSHAAAIARSLPEDDPVRLFVLGDEQGLRGLAERPGADGLTRQLAGRGLAATSPELGDPGDDLSLPPFVPTSFRLALYVAAYIVEQNGLDPASTAAGFEQQVAERNRHLGGPFLNADTYHAYLSGAFYSEIYREASRRLGGRERGGGSIERRLGGADGLAAELSRWYMHLESPNPAELEADLQELDLLGPTALRRTLDALQSVDPARQKRAAHALASRLDSRISHQFMLASLSGSHLYDPRTRERLYRRIAEVAGLQKPRVDAWLAMYRRDARALAAIAFDPNASPDLRIYALELAASRDVLEDSEIRTGFRGLVSAAPLDWDVREAFLEYLEDEDDVDASIELVRDWLERSGEPRGFPTIFARTAMARLLQARGDLDRALEWVEPVVSSGQNGAIGRAALIQAERRVEAEATAFAVRAVEFYPNSVWSRSVLAEVHWRLGRPEAAAEVVRGALPILGANGWSEIVRAFADAFHDRPVAPTAAAMEALRSAGIPTYLLIGLGDGLERRGRADLAFELTSRYGPGGSLEGLWWTARAYGHLAEAEGEVRASEWYTSQISPGIATAASMFMFNEGHPHLLWSAIPNPEATSDAPWVWLMRAAAFTRWGGDERHRNRLLEHFADDVDNPYHRIGRYLMDLDSEADVLAVATEPDRLCEVAYYVALRAEAEGRMEDAIAWYRVVLDTGLGREGEYRWALAALASWVAEARSLRASQ